MAEECRAMSDGFVLARSVADSEEGDDVTRARACCVDVDAEVRRGTLAIPPTSEEPRKSLEKE